VSRSAEFWLEALHGLGLREPVRIMNVCGGHERAISLAGLRAAIPQNIELVPGPGCPVCICPEEDVFEAIQLALNEDVILVAFGDMLRVPVNVPNREPRSLEQAKAAGADIRPIASPSEAVRIARENPSQTRPAVLSFSRPDSKPRLRRLPRCLPKAHRKICWCCCRDA
jgi:hydrogenase expression/formation protein HypD